MNHLPTNTTLDVKRKGTTVTGLSAVPAFVEPANPIIASYHDVPAGKGFHIIFQSVIDVREQDFLHEGITKYRVVGVEHHRTRRFPHTEATASTIWGTD